MSRPLPPGVFLPLSSQLMSYGFPKSEIKLRMGIHPVNFYNCANRETMRLERDRERELTLDFKLDTYPVSYMESYQQ